MLANLVNPGYLNTEACRGEGQTWRNNSGLKLESLHREQFRRMDPVQFYHVSVPTGYLLLKNEDTRAWLISPEAVEDELASAHSVVEPEALKRTMAPLSILEWTS